MGIRDQYIKRQKINQIPNSYLQFQNKNYYEIDYGRNTRPSIIVTLGEKSKQILILLIMISLF